MRRLAIMLAAALLLVSCAFSPAGERSVNIITVGFGYPGTAEELPSPHSDARAMASELKLLAEASGFDVSLLSFTDDEEGNIVHDGKAITAGDMVKLMKGLRTEPQDLTIFYYSGHGAWQEEPGSMIILPGGSGMTLSSISGLLSGIGGRSLMLIDACHNPQSVEAFVSALADVAPERGERPLLLTAVLADKDAIGIAGLLAAAFPRVAVTQTKSPRALSADDYAQILREAGADVVATYPTVEAAALALCEESYVACGSITLAGELAGLFC